MEKKKGVMPDYEEDIFISYTHVDNDKLAKDHQGWVDYMHERLEKRLAQLLGEDPAIWRDPKLHGNDYFNDTLILKLQKIAILVAVLSPRYIKSEWCRKELKEFCECATKIRVHNKAPIFKVIKTPVKSNEYPNELRELLGYKFYEEDPASGQPYEFSHEIKFDSYPKFLQKVNDLAWDIKLFIESIQITPSGRLIPPTAKVVYLAVTAADVDAERDKIKRELQDRGYYVLPDRDFPTNQTRLEEAIREDLRRSHLSIHLIGARYDDPDRQMPQSLVRLQYELAVEQGQEGYFAQVVWIPKSLEARDDEQRQLVDYLRRDATTHTGVEVLQDRLEDLKTNVLSKLKNLDRPETHTPLTQELVYIYLIHDVQDYEATAQLRNFLHDQKFELIHTVMEGEPAEVLQANKESLNDCDAVIIFYGKTNDRWMQKKLGELRKCKGLGRTTELLGKGLYISEPTTKLKEDYRSNEITVMRDQGEFPPKELVQFLEEIRARANARNLIAKGVGR